MTGVPDQQEWDEAEDEAELVELRGESSGSFPPLPPEVRAYELPVSVLRWDDFERLCERLARHEGGAMGARRYGRGGQKQHGIDIYGVRPDGRYRVWQCKQYADINDIDVVEAAQDFLDGPWGKLAENFTFCTSLLVSDTNVEDDVVAARALLAKHKPPIEFDFWDGREISHLLETRPREVFGFFGPEHYRRFIGPAADSENDPTLSAIAPFAGVSRPQTQIRIVSLPVEPAQVREVLEQLRGEAPTELVTLLDLVGEPPGPGRAQRVIEAWPPLLDSCRTSTLSALALLAEHDGAWPAASRAWKALGDRVATVNPTDAAGYVTLAAVAAKIAGASDEYDRLIGRARELDPDHPRLAVELLPADTQGSKRIEVLTGLETDDPQVTLLIKCNLALGYLLELDFSSAEQALRSIPSELAMSVALRATKLNLAVHRARVETLNQHPIDGTALAAARRDALELRDQLLTQRRYEESARLLMLAVDASMLLGDRGTAIRTLRGYRPEERNSETGSEVLAAVALRIGDWDSAVVIAEAAVQTPSLERLRAAAIIESDRASELPAALAVLDEAIATGGHDGIEAAMFRLAATMKEGVSVPWNDAAAELVIRTGHERVAVISRAFFMVRHHADYEGAYKLLDQHAGEPWSMGPRLILVRRQGNRSVIREAARRILAAAPGQNLRLQCAYALVRSRDLDEALAVAIAVAREPSAPRLLRANAFDLAVRLLAVKSEWGRAREVLDEWTQVAPGDPRASAFTPPIVRRTASG